jgi:hypothetical protein
VASAKCFLCHAPVPVPAELEATVMTCSHCDAVQPVPDLEVRRRLLLEQQREQRMAEQQRADEARRLREEEREERERSEDKKERRRGRWGTRLMSLVAILAAPTIIAITVVDAPARLGCGASGSDRLGQLAGQLQGEGCTVLREAESEYASSNVSRIVKVDKQCIRVLAAGGDGHRTLSLRLFGADGKQLAKAGDTTDPQLSYCAPAPASLRYEVGVGPASKGRLSHMVLSCPKAP